MDELIAWGHIDIPPQVIQRGETHEDWYMLSGKQGDNQEGMINLVLSYTVIEQVLIECLCLLRGYRSLLRACAKQLINKKLIKAL